MKKIIALFLLLFSFSLFLFGCADRAEGGSEGGGSIVRPLPDNGGTGGDGTDNGGTEDGGSDNGGSDNGGTGGDGTDNGGSDNGGTDNGGTGGDGTDNGGADDGGTDNGGTDNGGADDGGTDNGGADNGGTGGGDTDDGGNQTPVPTVKQDVLVMSKTDSLSIRAGRGTSYKKLGEIDKGDMLAFKDFSSGWYEVWYKNGVGYVSAAYLSVYSFEKGAANVEAVVDEGKKLMGLPYVYGAPRYHWGNGIYNTAFTGKSFDCSSLIQYIFKKGVNVNLDTTSRSQSVQGKYVAKSALKRGDVMFFTNDSRAHLSGSDRIGHVALYLGDNYILHTASDYAVIEQISSKRWSYFITARRMV